MWKGRLLLLIITTKSSHFRWIIYFDSHNTFKSHFNICSIYHVVWKLVFMFSLYDVRLFLSVFHINIWQCFPSECFLSLCHARLWHNCVFCMHAFFFFFFFVILGTYVATQGQKDSLLRVSTASSESFIERDHLLQRCSILRWPQQSEAQSSHVSYELESEALNCRWKPFDLRLLNINMRHVWDTIEKICLLETHSESHSSDIRQIKIILW